MIKIDWNRWLHKRLETWTIFGFYSATLVEGGSMANNSNVVGQKWLWSWRKWDKDTPNIFRFYNRSTIRKKQLGI